MNYTVRCPAHLILSECYSPYLRLWLWTTASESILLDLLHLSWLSMLLLSDGNFFNHLVTALRIHFSYNKYFSLLLWRSGPVQTRLSNHTQTEAIHDVSAHQLIRYGHLQQVPYKTVIASFMWNAHRKLKRTKILQNILLTLIYIYISWPTVVKSNLKGPFSIATPFHGLLHSPLIHTI